MSAPTRTITLQEVRAAAKGLDPETENSRNRLRNGDGGPCCLAGNLLAAADAPLPPSGDMHQFMGCEEPTWDYFPWAARAGVGFSDAARRFLHAAQAAADDLHPWGEAIKAGNRAVRR